MRERQVLECISKVAIMEFSKTQDTWWKELAEKVEEKANKKRWWQK